MSSRAHHLLALLLGLAACRRDRSAEHESTPPVADAPARKPVAATPTTPPPAPERAREPLTIYADELARATEHGPAWLLRQLAPEPYRRAGRFAGWTITARFPDDPQLAAACDLEIGDVIVAVEGDALATPTSYSAMFERADELQTLHVARIRNGRREELVYRIAPAPLP